MKKHMLLGALLAALGGAGAAHADDDDCHVPMDRWQPRAAVQEAARSQGWQVGRIKIDDGCYEIKGTDAQGRSFKATLDPATLEVVEMKRKDRGRDRRDPDDDDDDRRARGEGRQTAPGTAPPATLPPPGRLLGSGAPPAVVVK